MASPGQLAFRIPAHTIICEETAAVPYSNPELEMIGKEIEELVKEKHQLETDIAQKEADIKIKSGEIKSLQSELDTLAATLKQLENQKGEAQKRLNDLSSQVDKLQKEADEQEATVKVQEEEVGARRRELEDLRQEEANLEGQLQGSKARVEDLTKHLQDAQLQISQAKAKISALEEQKRRMGDAIATLDSALSTGDLSVVPQSVEEIEPDDFRDAEVAKLIGANVAEATDTSAATNAIGNESDAFGAATSNGPVSSLADSFKDDPFRGGGMQSSNDPFGSSDPFGASFPAQANDGFSADPFAAAFGGTAGTSAVGDPFDPFRDSNGGGSIDSKTPVDMSGKDPFGCDPFAAVPPAGTNGHTPPPTAPRPESPTPALPPKKSRQPPPRPAPPKHLAGGAPGPTRAAPQPPLPTPSPVPGPTAADWDSPSSNPQDPFGADPFSGSNAGGGGGFADFANFDGKFSGKADDHSISRGDSVPLSATWMAQQPKQDLKSLPVKTDSASPAPSANRYSELEFTEDPFRDYRYEDPFEMEDPFADEVVPGGLNMKVGDDPFCAPRQSSSSSTDSPAFARHRGPQLPPPVDEGAPPAMGMRMAVSSTSSA
ncbi:hypothetical protein J437_LFUL007030 [Ladona fulva]|uniref:Epidermal growth factor receptor substrate 15 n=1 Tax=Ladona fulva TaxID=123851 RepID=A0A8K0K5X2_LADFU|nr:hypothetical protein J437_LFUL007030 [Ladona fulva]